MLDRFYLLNELIENLTGSFDKKASEEEDFDYDFPIYHPPTQEVEEKQTKDDFDFDFPIYTPPKIQPVPATVPITTPSTIITPTSTVQEPSVSVPNTKQELTNKDLPSWFDPEWTSIQKFKLSDEPPSFLKLRKEPKQQELQTKQIYSEPTIEVEQEPKYEPKMSSQEAKDYLRSLPETQRLEEALTALEVASEEIRDHFRNKKLMATVFSLVISHLEGLINNADTSFGTNKDSGMIATKILIDVYYDKLKRLPSKYQEMAGRKIEKTTEGRKKNPLKELKSQWYGPEMVFVNNRAIRLMKHASNIEGGIISFDDAVNTAQEEWIALEQLVEGLVPEFSYENKTKLQDLGAKELVGGSSFEDAKKRIVQYLEAIEEGTLSTDNLGTEENDLGRFFPNIKEIDISEEWRDNAEVMLNERIVRKGLKDLPPIVINELAPQIVQFSKLAVQWNMIENAHDLNDLLKAMNMRGQVTPNEVANKQQEIYENIERLIQHIFIINPEYIAIPSTHKLLENVYIVGRHIRAEANEEDLSSLSTARAAQEAGLQADPGAPQIKNLDPKFKRNPRLQRPNEDDVAYKRRQKYEKEMADKYRYNFIQRILLHGDPDAYMKQRRLYQLGRRKGESQSHYDTRREKESKIHEIDKPDYKSNNMELVKWKELATHNSIAESSIDDLIDVQRYRTYKMFQTISKSTLKSNTLSLLEKRLIRNRIRDFQKEYYEIKDTPGMNLDVITAMGKMIEQIPSYFAEAKERVKKESSNSSKISLDMSSIYMKYADRLAESFEV